MAYLALLASVTEDEINRFPNRTLQKLQPSLVERCSHILNSWVRPPRLRELLAIALDGGEVLRQDLWHPLRVPLWQGPEAVIRIERALSAEWEMLARVHGQHGATDWYAIEISKVLNVFRHAAASGNGIVSVLCPPSDEERAGEIEIPFEARAL